jgi:hypothetical protein
MEQKWIQNLTKYSSKNMSNIPIGDKFYFTVKDGKISTGTKY